jgi:hypothetical protein
MPKKRLNDIAYGRSGDKGNSVNIGIAARNPADYELLCSLLTAERVKEYFAEFCHGEVTRYELPNLSALNFLLSDALDGGGTVSLRSDAQGKTFAAALLAMEID